MRVLVTGGSGFIGCNLVRHLTAETDSTIINVDKLTYAANPASLADLVEHPRYTLEQADVADADALSRIFKRHSPDVVVHLAAESHVDRSIDGPSAFVETNVVGTFRLLQVASEYFGNLDPVRAAAFRFLHVSTDEVFGSLGPTGRFTESTAYDPRSPYAASKAGADHLARAWNCTYGLPVIVTNCSNNYGPYQFPEKLLPLIIIRALRGQSLPVYGKGANVRDWLSVEDHVRALRIVLDKGRVGQTYNIGGDNERQNIDLVRHVCEILDELSPRASGRHQDAIEFVSDRPGHDLRYAIDASKIRDELGWQPQVDLASGLRKTIAWYLEHQDWWQPILDRRYQLERLGSGRPEPAADSP